MIACEGQTVFDEFNCDITESEISDAIIKLKLEKSNGPDVLLNVFFIRFRVYNLPIIHKFLNRIFKTGFYPQT